MVTIFLPAIERTGVTQVTMGRSSASTVQARHWPSPQPYFVPVNLRSSRITSSSGRSGSVSTTRSRPFTVNRNCGINHLRRCNSRVAAICDQTIIIRKPDERKPDERKSEVRSQKSGGGGQNRPRVGVEETAGFLQRSHEESGVTVSKIARENQVVAAFLERALRNIHASCFVGCAPPPEALGNVGRNGDCGPAHLRRKA